MTRLTEQIRAKIEPTIVEAHAVAEGADKERAYYVLSKLKLSFLKEVATAHDSAQWAKLLVREHLDPGPAFNIVMSDSGADFVEIIAQLIARTNGKTKVSPSHYIQAFATAGEILAFRLMQPAVIQKMGWQEFGLVELNLISQALEDERWAVNS